jgi:glutamate/tyrosine decarboxylase-like PLP-dependent enzyme
MIRGELHDVVRYADNFLDRLPERPVHPAAGVDTLRKALGGSLPDAPTPVAEVVRDLMDAAEPGILATTSPRFFGFVIGGATPAAIAADWLTTLWDQNAGLYAASPAAAVVEEVAGSWLKELLGLPPDASFGFVTGGQMANFTCLAAARHDILRRADWDVQRHGLQGAPKVRIVVGEERHSTIDRALRYLGFGDATAEVVASDKQGRLRADELRRALGSGGEPTIVCAQAGNVNSGACDPIGEICDIAHDVGAWVHVDGAFGLWAAASPRHAHLLAGHERANSWATDAHKWLNVPYDSGIAFCSDAAAHRAAMEVHASYLIHADPGAERDEIDWNPEFSRRARGFATYAALRALGKNGVTELIERCCDHATRFAELLGDEPHVEVVNDVVLNQVLVHFGDDETTRRTVARVQQDGTCWLSGSSWKGRAVMRISVSNWATTERDVERSAASIIAAARAV